MREFTILKRDGKRDRFSLDKIMTAIIKAFQSVGQEVDLGSISKILSHLDIKSDITDTKRAEYLQEYNDFQAYREKAKEVATKAVAILEELKSKTDGGTATDSATSTTKSTETAASESSASSEATGTSTNTDSASSTSSSSSTESK